MARLSASQIAQHAATVGFAGRDLTISIAVAMAESGGNPNAHHVTSREDSRGLWQINVRAHPEFTSANLYDPATNAQAARTVLTKQGWGAWTTYKLGIYMLYMGQAEVAAQRVEPKGGILARPAQAGTHLPDFSGAPSVVDSAQALASGFNKVNRWVTTPANCLRVVYVIVGSSMVVVSIAMLARPAVAPIVKTAVTATNPTAAAKWWFGGRA